MSWRDMVDNLNVSVVATFGETVTYIPLATGIGYETFLHFESVQHQVDFNNGVAVEAEKPHAYLRIADLNDSPEPGDKIVAQGKTYSVTNGEVDGYGAVQLWLSEDLA